MISSLRSSDSPLTMGGELFGWCAFLGGRGSRRKLGSFNLGKIFLGVETLGARCDCRARDVLFERALFDFVERVDVLRDDLDEEELVVLDLRAMERNE